MSDALLIARSPLVVGFVETWTLHDPASRNALSEAMVEALFAACERAQADTDLRGVVLRGADGHFCAGGSLGGFAKTIGQPLPAGETGEVVVRGDTVMPGYWNNPNATAQTLRDGWLYTGDMGALDADGFLTLKDRSKDVIISGGSNIYPREVEEVLLLHPRVREVAVVGQRDAEWGEVVVAFLVAGEGGAVPEAELDALCLEHIARFKRPKEYRWVAALPKNSYGKVMKTELRAKS